MTRTRLRALAGAMGLAALARGEFARCKFWAHVGRSDPALLGGWLRGITVAPYRPQAALEEFAAETAAAFTNGVDQRDTEPALLLVKNELLDVAGLVAVAERSSRIRLVVESNGGCSRQAEKLLTALEEADRRGATVETEVFHAASAAAVLVAACPGRRTIVEGGRLILHGPWAAVLGSPRDLRLQADALETSIATWADRLAQRTGQPAEVCRAWLGENDVEFTPEAAIAHGLVDEILR